MLSNTLILPESDARLAKQLLRDAIDNLDVVLMLVIGKDGHAPQIVEWADKLARKTRTPDGNLRRVVWIRDLSATSMKKTVREIVGDPLPRVAVLNFFDSLKATLHDSDRIEPIELELAFLKGHHS